jgi:hypothetical protein
VSDLLPVPQAAKLISERLGIRFSRTRLWYWIRHGKMPAQEIAGRLYIERPRLEAWLSEQRKEVTSA